MSDGELDSFILRIVEYDITETWAACIVHVQNRLLGPSKRFECTGNEVGPSRCQNLTEQLWVSRNTDNYDCALT